METENNRKTRLQKLSGSDFEIVDSQPDIRGWNVQDSSGKQLGEVEELIFDYESRKVRYLVVDLDGNDYDMKNKKVLVPIGIAELHEKEDDVILPDVTPAQLNDLPEYDEERFDTEHELGVRNVFGGLGSAALNGGSKNDNDFYDHSHFNENNLYRNRKTENANAGTTLPDNNWNDINPGGVRLRSGSNTGNTDKNEPGYRLSDDTRDEPDTHRIL